MQQLIRILIAAVCALPLLAASKAGGDDAMRLPDYAVPLAYHLAIKVDPERATHTGEVAIDVDVLRATSRLRLNATHIAVQSAVLRVDGHSYPARTRVMNDEQVELRFGRTLPVGAGVLTLRFRGVVSDKEVSGLFRQREGGDWYAFTQFEATGARRAFPGFDEPGWKVPWTLALTVPKNLMAVANTPIARETDIDRHWKRVEFQTSQPMPSYLLAFGVGPFDVLDGGMVGKTPVRFITPRGRAQEARYAASMTPAILGKLEAYFGMAYPYEKLDMLALPLTVGFGAMENAGLITYASGLILARPEDETGQFKRNYVATAAHEMAHQWFGNYVTMAWWDDLWLNESFASWMGDKITDEVMPAWHWQSAVQSARASAMYTDRLLSTRRIHQPVNNKYDLGGAFDSITYSKGQVVLAMFETWLGQERFRDGVRSYIHKYAWANATGNEFIKSMAGGDNDLIAAFQNFTDMPGIPRLTVELLCDQRPRLRLSQSRFLPKGSAAAPAGLWRIPVSVRTPTGWAQLLLKEAQAELPLPGDSCPAWVQANAEGAGYYRVVYAPGQLLKLMKSNDLSVNEILAGLDDAQALTESGDLPVADALQIAERYANHPQQEVVQAVQDILERVKVLVGPAQRDAYAALWQRSFGARARSLGLTIKATDTSDDRLLRAGVHFQSGIVEQVADFGADASLRAEAKRLVAAWLKDHSLIDAAVRRALLRIAAIDGDKALFDALVGTARITNNRVARGDIYTALGNFRDPTLAEAARQLLLSKDHDIRETLRILRIQNSNDDLRDGALRFVTQHFAALAARMPENLPGELPEYFNGACSDAAAQQLAQFFTPLMHRYEGGPTTLAQTLEAVRLCAVYKSGNSFNDMLK